MWHELSFRKTIMSKLSNGVSGRFLPGWNKVSPCGFVEVKPGLLLERDIMYKLTPLFLIFSLSSAFFREGSLHADLCARCHKHLKRKGEKKNKVQTRLLFQKY